MPCSYHPGCQFHEETEFFHLMKGGYFCRYHLPLEGKKDLFSKGGLAGHDEEVKFAHGIRDLAQNSDQLLDFRGVEFTDGFDFRNIWDVEKRQQFNVEGAVFGDEASFKELTFPNGFIAGGAKFGARTDFEGVTFEGVTEFSDVTFGHMSNFSDATFNGHTTFDAAGFHGMSDFSDAIFDGWSSFVGATYFGQTSFRGAEFHQVANFSGVTFKKFAAFWGTKFLEYGSFGASTFKGNSANFSVSGNDLPNEALDFKRAQFFVMGDFSNRKFSPRSSFSETYFDVAPMFDKANLSQGLNIAQAKFEDIFSDHAAKAYEILKHAMQKHSAWNDMALFYALEQRSIRHQPGTKRSIRVMSWAYDLTSDYGRSFLRPLVGLCMVWLVGLVLYMFGHGVFVSGIPFGEGIQELVLFDLKQMVKPFDAITNTIPVSGLSGFGKFLFGLIATLQTIATAGFVTLFILAVRRRFRMA